MFPKKNILDFNETNHYLINMRQFISIIFILSSLNIMFGQHENRRYGEKTIKVPIAEISDPPVWEYIDSILNFYPEHKYDYYYVIFIDSIDSKHSEILRANSKSSFDVLQIAGINCIGHYIYPKENAFVNYKNRLYFVAKYGNNRFINISSQILFLKSKTMEPEDNITPTWSFSYDDNKIAFKVFNDGLWGDTREEIIDAYKDTTYTFPVLDNE